MRIVLGVQYCGSAFEGWQTQPHGKTVQDHLTQAIAHIAGHAPVLYCAGRTDTGVHARQQVVHFDTLVQRPLNAWIKGVNNFLPDSIVVTGAAEVDESFHARFSALSRTYRYYFYSSSNRDPFKPFMTWVHHSLDLEKMRQACTYLLGTHDFSAFRASQCQAASPVRTLSVMELKEAHGETWFEIQGNAFLHHMVRNMVGTLMEVGLNRQPVEWVQEVLRSCNRSVAAKTWPAQGLSLWQVDYPVSFEIPQLFRNRLSDTHVPLNRLGA